MTNDSTTSESPNWRQRLQAWVRQSVRRSEREVNYVLTLILGAVVGLVIVAFIVVTESLGEALHPHGGARWRLVVVPTLGALVSGYLLYRYFPDARGSGIPQTKAALFARRGFISLKTVVGKFVCSTISLASGIALGREGPSVQVGSGVASVFGRTLGLKPEKVQGLVTVGASAALAAAFNTPLAAILFSLEEVMGNLHARVLGLVVMSSATSWLVLRLLLGDEPLFHVPEYQVVHPVEFAFYALLGVIGGLVSVAFVKLLLRMRERFLNMPRSTRWFQPAIGGLTVGILALMWPEVIGVGYNYVGEILNGNMALQLMAILVILKVFATAICYSSGNAGGIFGPSLFIGAAVGGTVGSIVHDLFPEITATAGAYALVGMGTAFAGILRVPMTSVIMIFEVTHDYHIIVPLMISNLISFYVSYKLQPQPIYEALAQQEGIHLPTTETAQRHLQVRLAMHAPRESFPTDMKISEALEKAAQSNLRAWPLVDDKGVWGVVSLEQLEKAVGEDLGDKKVTELGDTRKFPHVHDDHSLDLALERMGSSGYELLPVVSRANIHELEGVVSLLDVLKAFGVRETRGSP
jgi:CIC family chloride channel protein